MGRMSKSLVSVEGTEAMAACNCEHERHFNGGGHEYLAKRDLTARALYVGPICRACAKICLRGWLVK